MRKHVENACDNASKMHFTSGMHASRICQQNMPAEYASRICKQNMPAEYASRIYIIQAEYVSGIEMIWKFIWKMNYRNKIETSMPQAECM